LPGAKLTATNATRNSITVVPGTSPINTRPYGLPEAQKAEIEKQVEKRLDEGITEGSSSPWNRPLLVVPKKVDASGERSVPYTLYVYSVTVDTSTGYTPLELVYGFRSTLPSTLHETPSPQYNFVLELKSRLQTVHEVAKEKLLQVKQESKGIMIKVPNRTLLISPIKLKKPRRLRVFLSL
jgi:hypothetical protein